MTQGLVTIMKDGKVRMKIVAGGDGDRAAQLAAPIRALGRVPTLDEAYTLAEQVGFGSPGSLVVINETRYKFHGDGRLSKLYRSTFNRPRFNPRWHYGTADHIKVIKL